MSSKARLLADLFSDSQITASEIVGLELNSIQEGDTVVQVSDTGSGGKVVVRVDGADNAEFNANGMVIPKGTTAERDPAAVVGSLRYNTTIGFFETFTASGWGAVATPPSITSITPSNFNGEAGATFTVNGAFFDTDTTAVLKGADGTEYAAATVTFVNSTQITLTNATNLPVANEPFRVKVTNGAGLSAESVQGIDAGSVPAFTTAAGTLASATWTDPISVTVNATDAENTISGYAVTEGNLPAGLSLNTTTGAITGTSTEQATTTYTFTIGATDSAGNTNTRQFSIQIVNAAPVWSSPAEGGTESLAKDGAGSITLNATDPEGEAVSFTSGALPTGLSLSGNVISGTPTVEANTSVAVTASDGFASSVRNFIISVSGPLYAFSYHTFTSAGAIGRNGPTQAELDAAYGSQSWYSANTFRSTSGIQIWTVPNTSTYRFQIQGGYGGRDTQVGRPAEITADIPLVKGQEIKILVGQRGLPFYKEGSAGGGGGGTFVTYLDNTPLLVAGGGGGADGGPYGGHASLTTDGGQDGPGTLAAATGGAGGLGQNGAGGGGLTGDGADTSFAITAPPTVSSPKGGLSFINGGAGGQGFFEGGFGGGGGSAGESAGGGGGGGYSGGLGGNGNDPSPDTGGGGSFVASNATNTSSSLAPPISDPGANNPDTAPNAGFVTITQL